jgi:hypothetical protein
MLKSDPNYDKNYISPYIFDNGIIPLGKLRIRQQRRKIINCEGLNVVIAENRKDKKQ